MWHPADSSVPFGIGFLVLSSVAQFTSAAAVVAIDADGSASIDPFQIFERADKGTATTSTEVIFTDVSTSSDVLTSTDIPTDKTIDDTTIITGILTSSDALSSTGVPTVSTSAISTSDVLSSTDIPTVNTDSLSISTGAPTSSIGDTIIDDATVSTGIPTSSDAPSSTDTPSSDTLRSTDSENDPPASSTEPSSTTIVTGTSPGSDTTDKVPVPEPTTDASEPGLPGPVTAPPIGTTAAAAQATATASKYNDDVAIIIPIINAWAKDPLNLKTDTLNKVKSLVDGVMNAIQDLGGSKSSGCNKKKRGLLDIVSNVINTLSCVVSNLEDIVEKITGDIVDGVVPIVSTLTENNKDLEEESKEEEEEEKSRTDKEETETEKSETQTEDASTTEESTTTETETTTTTGECKMPLTTSIEGVTNTNRPPVPTTSAEQTDATTETGTSTGTDASSNTSGATSETDTTVSGTDTSGPETSTMPSATSTGTSEASTATEETELPTTTTTPSTLLTTTRPSSDESSTAITSGSTISSGFITTTQEETSTEPTRTYFPCGIFGGPRVATAYCQCTTTVSGRQYLVSTTMIDNSCADYTEFPGKIDPATEAPAPTEPAIIHEPVTQTIGGTVLAWSSYSLKYYVVYTGIPVTDTHGLGDPTTLSTPVPTQTAVDNDGSGQCGTGDKLSSKGLGEACNRAIDAFEDNVVYTGYTTRYSRSNKGLLMVASMGQAACIAKFSCDDYGIGMSGKLIKEAREKAQSENNIWMWQDIKKKQWQKTYNTGDSLVVTDPTTNPALRSLTLGERTGPRILYELWSYVLDWWRRLVYDGKLKENGRYYVEIEEGTRAHEELEVV
ncbi:hypothetical protein ACJ41O_013090 [Fusarium nematophilum]